MPRNDPQLSKKALEVLARLASQPTRVVAGSDILKEIGILSGTLYPILFRLEKAGWLSSEWEQVEPNEAGRPRKRFYRITALGERKTKEALSDLTIATGRVSWA